MLPPLQQPENQKMLACLLEYYEKSTGRRRETIAALTGRILAGLASGRKKEVRNARELAEQWLTWLQQETDMQEEMLFDGELKFGEEWEEEDKEGWI